MGYKCNGGSSGTKDSLKNKVSFTEDTTTNTVFLKGNNFQPEDTAVYYCARQSQRYTQTGALYKNVWDSLQLSNNIV